MGGQQQQAHGGRARLGLDVVSVIEAAETSLTLNGDPVLLDDPLERAAA